MKSDNSPCHSRRNSQYLDTGTSPHNGIGKLPNEENKRSSSHVTKQESRAEIPEQAPAAPGFGLTYQPPRASPTSLTSPTCPTSKPRPFPASLISPAGRTFPITACGSPFVRTLRPQSWGDGETGKTVEEAKRLRGGHGALAKVWWGRVGTEIA